eukprot:TRINITY_DN10265_c0_g1_i1.p1 TRINITY_DN10265_c0_g1~~TRINITY_DN10265_c0_g1_i1.p1  ORF type:complete len:107 (-),score=28.89 TRINITY_DN10265_c0_g1_i1:70-390(-)
MTYSVAVGKEGGGNHHTHPPTPPGATAADEGGSNNLQVLSFASKAVGAGTFLYIGIAEIIVTEMKGVFAQLRGCLLYTSDAADEEDSVDLGGRRIIKKKKKEERRY